VSAAIIAERHVQDPHYVEARGYLQPAVDFFSRAVKAADEVGETGGELLESVGLRSTTIQLGHAEDFVKAAEACMSLGNVSSTFVGQQYFTQAIRYLRRGMAPFITCRLRRFGKRANSE